MKSTKILFTDLDDTLLNREKEITPGNHLAIEKALSQGHRIVLNSGRPLMGITAQIKKLGLEKKGCYAIAYNGGMVYDCLTQEILYRKTISLPDVNYIFHKASQYGLFCQTYDSTRLIAPKDDPHLQTYVRRMKIPYVIDPNCPASLTEEPVKVLVIGDDSRKLSDAYRKEISAWGAGRISVFYSNQTYLEHVPAHVSKGNAMEFLCQHLGIPIENTVGAGDAENDLPMLRTAGIGAAVKNATEPVKVAADYVCKRDCDHDAIAEVLEKFFSIS